MAISAYTLYLVQAIVTTMMVGVIWTVQIVLYPLFYPFTERREISELKTMHEDYTPKITLVVLPLMFSELGLALWGLFSLRTFWDVLLLLLVIGPWALTFFISVPLHNTIANSDSPEKIKVAVKRLILTNWPRTVLWTTRGLILWYLLLKSSIV